MCVLHRKNNFAAVSKNLIRHRSENNFIWPLKFLGIQTDC